MAAASAGSVNRTSSVSCSAPWVCAMSRRTPPAPIAASCWSSPISRTLPPRSMTNWTAVSRVRVSAMPASSITTRVVGPMRSTQSGSSPGSRDQVSLARVSVRRTGLVAQAGGRGGRRGEAEQVAAAVGPGRGQRPHRGGLAGAGGRERQLQPGAGGGHRPDQGGLPGVEGDPVGGRLQQRQVDAAVSTVRPSRRPAAATRRCSAARTVAEVYWSAPATV